MSYRKDQGRYARMVAYWGLVCLVAYGCFHGGGLVTLLDGWLGANNTVFIDPFPLIGSLKISTSISLGVLALGCYVIHGVLNKPRVADTLIDTEAELHKVTWPTWNETWAGTLAVGGMVIVLFLFLTVVDLALVNLMKFIWGGA